MSCNSNTEKWTEVQLLYTSYSGWNCFAGYSAEVAEVHLKEWRTIEDCWQSPCVCASHQSVLLWLLLRDCSDGMSTFNF